MNRRKVGLFVSIFTLVCLAGAYGYYVFLGWDGKWAVRETYGVSDQFKAYIE